MIARVNDNKKGELEMSETKEQELYEVTIFTSRESVKYADVEKWERTSDVTHQVVNLRFVDGSGATVLLGSGHSMLVAKQE